LRNSTGRSLVSLIAVNSSLSHRQLPPGGHASA
jgi:hypothetical protein